ncbi:Signal recognition particle, SRP9 subunit [Niveomyces insectorum RCEF 264]|uniref:Signal recognition particle, SRP9 subunit n=1 Tax=Niveomyces insectorum RCEF 264 TaxID=1081102 RepID=A0A167QX46_9HYPO|nr:Signal recognition particle, SRP9 subunit [Niveomyces insectorum RCEF 264]
MATFATSQQWLHQSALLLEARPQTTKITCRYSVKPKPARRRTKTSKAVDDNGDVALPDAPPAATKPGKSAAAAATTGTTAAPRATLVLKAVDPASGVCLKYKTTKAAEVSRLVQLLGQLSQRQAGLVAAAAATADEPEEAETPAAATSAVPSPAPAAAQLSQQPQQQQSGGGGGGGGGKGKKKKGKR